MPISHILRLVMDPRQYTVCIWSPSNENDLLAVVSFRPFVQQNFTEIAFLGVELMCQHQVMIILLLRKKEKKKQFQC